MIVLCLVATPFAGMVDAGRAIASDSFNEVDRALSKEFPLYDLSAPLNITSDASLAENATAGSGSEEDPYIISGLSINASGGALCIRVTGTTAFFSIEGNELTGAVGSDAVNEEYGSGVTINDVPGGTATVLSNIIYNCSYGVVLQNSNNLTVADNEISDIGHDGIKVAVSSQDHVLVRNDIADVGRHGILLYGDEIDVNYLFQNNIDRSGYFGIYIYQGDNNTVHGNFVNGSDQWAVSLNTADDNLVLANTFCYNGGSTTAFDGAHLQVFDSGQRNAFGSVINGVWTGNYWLDLSDQTVLENGTVDSSYPTFGTSGTEDPYPSAMPVNHSPVLMNGDLDEGTNMYLRTIERWGGNGSFSSPYLWDDWVINAQGGLFGISLIGTASGADPADLLIRNVTVMNANATSITYTGAAIHLESVGMDMGGSSADGRITLQNVTCGGSVQGIYMEYAIGVVLNGSNMSGNDIVGINLYGSSQCTISDNVVSNNGGMDADGAGIYAYDCGLGTVISGNDIFDNSAMRGNGSSSPAYFAGVYSAYNDAINITGNRIHDNLAENRNELAGGNNNVSMYCIYSLDDTRPVISGNNISDNHAQAYLDSSWVRTYFYCVNMYLSDNATIADNLVQGNSVLSSRMAFMNGLELSSTPDCVVTGNTIADNSALNPVASNYSSSVGIDIFDGDRLVIQDNVVRHNIKVGLSGLSAGAYMVSTRNITVIGNEITGNNFTTGEYTGNPSGFGLYLNSNVRDSVFSSNEISYNYNQAIYLAANTHLNEIYLNAFIYNMNTNDTYQSLYPQCVDVSTDNLWYDAVQGVGNQWTDWMTPDIDGDDIVDEVYVISDTVNDPYPLASDVARATSLEVSLNGGSLELDWTASRYALYGDAVSYDVYRSFDGVAFAVVNTTTSTDFTEPCPAGMTDVRYYVVARTAHGTSAASMTVTLSESIVPVVRIISPAGGSVFGGRSVTVTWEGWDNQSGLSYYDVHLDSGQWVNVGLDTEYALSSLADGDHTFYVRAVDGKDNQATTSVSFSVEINLVLTISSPDPLEVFDVESVQASWAGSNVDASISRYDVRVDTGPWVNVSLSTTYLMTGLSEGNHTFYVRAVDGLANELVASVGFSVAMSPEVMIVSPSSGTTFNVTSVQAEWQGWDNQSGLNRYEVRVDTGSWVNVSLNTTYLMTGLSEGDHTFYVRAVDNSSNQATESVQFTVSGAPWVSIDGVPSLLNTAHPELSWTGGDDQSSIARYEVKVDSGAWTNVGLNTSLVLNVSEGAHTVYVRAFDQVGNNTTAKCSFTVDLSAPTVLSGSPNSTGVSVRPTITIVFSELMDIGNVTVTGVEGTVVWDGDTMTIQTIEDLDMGAVYNITVNGKDLAGNSMLETTFSFTTVEAEQTILNGSLVDEDGNAISGVLITCSNGDTATTNATGNFQFLLDAGHYHFNATKAGYETLSFEKDLVAGGEVNVTETMIAVSEAEGDDGGMMLILVLVIVIIAAIAVGVLLWKRRKV